MNYPLISNRTKDLIFKVSDGRIDLMPLMHFFINWVRCDEMLEWCIKNQITGALLAEWVNHKWGKSQLPVVEFIIMKLENRSAPRSLFVSELHPNVRYTHRES